MSVMINGMEMPEECRECPLEMYYSDAGETRCRATNSVLASGYKTIAFDGRAEDCPLAVLVQCKECAKYIKAGTVGYCEEFGAVTRQGDYCSSGILRHDAEVE